MIFEHCDPRVVSVFLNRSVFPDQRYHNNSLLERKSDSTLVLKNLHLEHAGEYYCRASGQSGAIKTKPAMLNIIGMLQLTRKITTGIRAT